MENRALQLLIVDDDEMILDMLSLHFGERDDIAIALADRSQRQHCD